ncbi:hypothetical protein B0T21DRAFT_380875 [Apiosordaria backusii]|uniref:NTF2-like domain-containing protein n=1 Tax=Apiosordaria backusii TaxID=314023 RepID=A0AA40ESH3_9PEZI|nr:hypothetical protein B0T21DRAFT_380875 [Apiosordaria backusii]
MRSFIPLLTLTGFSAAATLRPIRQRQPVFDDLVDTLRGPNSDSKGWIPDPWNDRVSSSTTDAAATATTIDLPTVVPGTDTLVTVPDVTGGDDGTDGGADDGADDGGDDGADDGTDTPVTLPDLTGGNPNTDDGNTPVTLPDLTGGNPGAGGDSPVTLPDLTGNPGAGGNDGTDGTDGTDSTDGTDNTTDDTTTTDPTITLPNTPVTNPNTPGGITVRPINNTPIRFPATPAAGQAETCLSSEAAEVLIDAYVRMITKWNDDDAYYLSESFYDASDSINSLAGIPLGTTTFPTKESFIEHQHVMPDNLPLVITHNIVDCTEITLIWTATFAVPHVQPKPVRGIAILKALGELEDTEAEYVQGENDYVWKIGGLDVEFNNIAYLQNIGGSCEFPTGP